MDINEIKLSCNKREQYENEKQELYSTIKQKIKDNEEENKYLHGLIKMTKKEFDDFFYKTKECELNKRVNIANNNKNNHITFVNFIMTLLAILTSFIAGAISTTFVKSLDEKYNIESLIIAFTIFLAVIAIVSIIVYWCWFHKDTIQYSNEIINAQNDIEDLNINKI